MILEVLVIIFRNIKNLKCCVNKKEFILEIYIVIVVLLFVLEEKNEVFKMLFDGENEDFVYEDDYDDVFDVDDVMDGEYVFF